MKKMLHLTALAAVAAMASNAGQAIQAAAQGSRPEYRNTSPRRRGPGTSNAHVKRAAEKARNQRRNRLAHR